MSQTTLKKKKKLDIYCNSKIFIKMNQTKYTHLLLS